MACEAPSNLDLYTTWFNETVETRHRTQMPEGFTEESVQTVPVLVLKPDAQQFRETFPDITQALGTVVTRRQGLLRYLINLFPRAQIIDSAGGDCNFHVVLHLERAALDRPQALRVLRMLRLMAFCEKVKAGFLPALTARAVGSINSKSSHVVHEVKPSADFYTWAELEVLVDVWLTRPAARIVRGWFGLAEVARTVRCFVHDSADNDLLLDNDNHAGVACTGSAHCAAGGGPRSIPLFATDDHGLGVLNALLTPSYLKQWEGVYLDASREWVAVRKVEALATTGKVVVEIKSDTTTDGLVDVVGAALLSGGVYATDTAFATVEIARGTGQHVMRVHETVDAFQALLERFCVFCHTRGKGVACAPLDRARTSVLLHSPALRDKLPLLRRVTSAPVLDLASNRVAAPGYDLAASVYYSGPPITPRTDGQTPVLDFLLGGWTGLSDSQYRSCKTDRDVAHLYAAVFTEVLADSGLFTLHRHPLLRGNQKGLGKDKFAEILGVLRDGTTPVDLMHHDENRQIQAFGNGVTDGRRIFQVTNIATNGRPYTNALITRYATSESITGARHGGGKYELSPNTATFVLTQNAGEIDYDLLDRLLPIDLEAEGDARTRTFTFDPAEYVQVHKATIISEVLGLCLQSRLQRVAWDVPQGTDCRFKTWMLVIGLMLKLRGLPGFMTNMQEIEADLSADDQDFQTLLLRWSRQQPELWLTAKEVYAHCQGGGNVLFADRIKGRVPERDLSRFVLMPKVGTHQLCTDGPDVTVELQRKIDKNRKAPAYKLTVKVPTCGDNGVCGDEKNNLRNTPPHGENHTSQAFTETCGDRGDETDRASTVQKVKSDHSVSIAGAVDTSATSATSASPQNANHTDVPDVSDLWGGGTV